MTSQYRKGSLPSDTLLQENIVSRFLFCFLFYMVLGDVYGCSPHIGYFLPYRWHIPRGGSNSIVLHNYCNALVLQHHKVLQ